MNQPALLYALRQLVVDNESTLVSGLTQQDVAREIGQIAISVMDAPVSFYYVLVQIEGADSRSSSSRSNNKAPKEACDYDCAIHIIDQALRQQGDTFAYEQVTIDFRELCDRVIVQLRDTWCFSADSPYDTPKFRLKKESPDRRVRVTNLDQDWYDEGDALVASILYCRLKFRIEETWIT